MSAQSASRAAYAALGQKNAGPVITKKEASSVINVKRLGERAASFNKRHSAPAQNSISPGPQPLDAQRFMIASTAAANTAKNAPPLIVSRRRCRASGIKVFGLFGRRGKPARRVRRAARMPFAARPSRRRVSRYGPGKYASPRMAAQAFSSRYPAVIPATPTTFRACPSVARA
jgi:hypothetical protein